MPANLTIGISTHAARAFRSALCVLAALCAIVHVAVAEPPPGALAWAVVEPRERGPEWRGRAVPGEARIDALVHAMLPARTPASGAVVRVVGHAITHGNRVEAVLLDFAAHPGPKDGTAIMDRFSFVVRVEGGDGASLRAVVREGFPDAPADASTFAADGAPAWQTIAISDQPGEFLLGVGPDALASWSRAAAATAEPAWAVHRAALDSHQAGASIVAAAFADANALRRAFPESFASGRLGRIAQAWGISNARSIMVRAAESPRTDAPPALLIAAAFEARSQPPGSVAVEPIVGPSWPGGAAALAGDGVRWASVVPGAWSRAYDWGVRTWEASCDGWGVIEFDARRARWERRHMPRLQRLFASTGSWAIITPNRFTVPLADNVDPAHVAADLAAILATFGERSTVAGLEGTIRIGSNPGATVRWTVRDDGTPALAFELTN